MKKSASTRADATVASATPTLIEIILDETSSMGWVKNPTIQSYNEFISSQKEITDAACLVTLTKFSTNAISTPFELLKAEDVPLMTADTFEPNGATNLYDTIAQRAAILSETIGDKPCNVVFLVITDGEDNQSRMHRAETIKRLLGEKMEAGWTFVYLGAHEAAVREADRMGFPAGNVKAFAAQEIATAMAATSNATMAYRSMRSSGAVEVGTSSMNFYGE